MDEHQNSLKDSLVLQLCVYTYRLHHCFDSQYSGGSRNLERGGSKLACLMRMFLAMPSFCEAMPILTTYCPRPLQFTYDQKQGREGTGEQARFDRLLYFDCCAWH